VVHDCAGDPLRLTGRWSVSIDFFGVLQYFTMQLVQQGTALSGTSTATS